MTQNSKNTARRTIWGNSTPEQKARARARIRARSSWPIWEKIKGYTLQISYPIYQESWGDRREVGIEDISHTTAEDFGSFEGLAETAFEECYYTDEWSLHGYLAMKRLMYMMLQPTKIEGDKSCWGTKQRTFVQRAKKIAKQNGHDVDFDSVTKVYEETYKEVLTELENEEHEKIGTETPHIQNEGQGKGED